MSDNIQRAKGLSGYIPTKNNFELDYCAQLGVQSLLPVCDEVIIVDAGSTDDTLPFFEEWASREPKIRIVHYELPRLSTPDEVERDDPNRPRGNPVMLIPWLNAGRLAARFDWQITLDADEVLSPRSYPEIPSAMQEGLPVLIERVNYWKSPEWEAPHGTVCGERVVRMGPTKMEMHSDEPCPEGEPEIRRLATFGNNFRIWHFGFLRRQKAFLKKSRIVQAMIHSCYDPRLRQAEQTGMPWTDYSPFPENKPLIARNDWGAFPAYVKEWLLLRGYKP